MARALFFDFFGTLVHYREAHSTADRVNYEWTLARGNTQTVVQYDAVWNALWDRRVAHAQRTRREFSLTSLCADFLEQVCPEKVSPEDLAEFVELYAATWSAPVTPVDGLRELLELLSRDHRLLIVTNTYHPPLVPALIRRFGLEDLLPTVIASVDVGWRKPDPHIFERALAEAEVFEADAVFIGDSFIPDFAGPTANGILSYLLDPDRRFALLPEENRIRSLHDLPALLGIDMDADSAAEALPG